eukprot:TRINITY_DN15697_c0_g1_i2.p1 TRINITY_DN15697_c0_g1~~TRINITY_DN15697_c0_g1_i2.p1  ORF type:complete len:136 (+),score=17.70 TRINITY_DN15697_c0_g1_i2:52-459(+)
MYALPSSNFVRDRFRALHKRSRFCEHTNSGHLSGKQGMSFVNMVLIYSWCRRAMKFARFSPYDDDSEIAAAEGSAEQISSESEEPFAKVRHQISDFSANVSESNIDSINVKNLLTSRGSYQQKKSDCKQVDLFTD